MAGGVELAYAEIVTDATRAATSYADVAGLTVTITRSVSSRPIMVKFDCCSLFNTGASGGVSVAILEDGVVIGVTSSLVLTANYGAGAHREIRRNPAAGAHTYKIQLKTLFSGTATITTTGAAAGNGPAYIQVVEI